MAYAACAPSPGDAAMLPGLAAGLRLHLSLLGRLTRRQAGVGRVAGARQQGVVAWQARTSGGIVREGRAERLMVWLLAHRLVSEPTSQVCESEWPCGCYSGTGATARRLGVCYTVHARDEPAGKRSRNCWAPPVVELGKSLPLLACRLIW